MDGREASVRCLARSLGAEEVRAGISPEGKVAIAAEETARAKTLFAADGINAVRAAWPPRRLTDY